MAAIDQRKPGCANCKMCSSRRHVHKSNPHDNCRTLCCAIANMRDCLYCKKLICVMCFDNHSARHEKAYGLSPKVKKEKKKVGFRARDSVIAVTADKEERHNPDYRQDKKNAETKATKLGGGDALADRSLRHAEGECNCPVAGKVRCESNAHKHDVVLDDRARTNCANASLLKCKHCSKRVCELCWIPHQKANHLTKKKARV